MDDLTLHQAAAAEEHVRWMRGLARKMEVLIPKARRHSDEGIVRRVWNAPGRDTQVPGNGVRVKVELDVVPLFASVDWPFQNSEAEDRAYKLAGVTRVDDRILVQPATMAADIKNKLERAVHRRARLHAAEFPVDMDGSKVTLTGRVPSLDERAFSENVAWSTVGVAAVKDQLMAQP